MKVAHFVTNDFGGAYRAAVRINQSMQEAGCDSYLYCRTITDSKNPGKEILPTKVQQFFSKGKNFCNLMLSSNEIVVDWFGTDICKKKEFQEADVIILHWINSFISTPEVKKIATQRKIVIWVMHDMWTFTGGCHCDKYCGRFTKSCGECPILGSHFRHDRTYRALLSKRRNYSQKGIVFVSPSRWLQSCAETSTILKGEKILRIPNPVPTDVFAPMHQQDSRREWGISSEKKVILFGALKATSDSNKGFPHLMKALDLLDRENYMVVMFGNDTEVAPICGFETKAVGVIKEEKKLASLYNAADVFVAPSEQDNYPNTVAEALSCGVPVAAFQIGGMPDLIHHRQSGYLAKFRDSQSLAEGIEFCVANRTELSAYARDSILNNNTYQIIGESYRDLCGRLLNG